MKKDTQKKPQAELIHLNGATIKTLLEKDSTSERKRLAKIGQRYYDAEHDIRDYRVFYYDADGVIQEDKHRSNIKISHAFFTELADQLSAFILSNTEEIIQAKEGVEGLQDLITPYFDEEFWAENIELITGSYVKGFDYLYSYKNEEDRTAFQYANGMGVVEVKANEASDGIERRLYCYVDRIDNDGNKIYKIQEHTAENISFFERVGETGNIKYEFTIPNVVYTDEETGERYGKSFGYVPFFRLDYNRNQTSGLKPIKGLIDDYDLMQCGLSNNLQDLTEGIFVVKGFNGDNLDELITNVKTKKAVGVGEGGDVDVRTIDIPYQARKAKADEDEKNIYRFGMGLNTQGLKDTNATTNLAIRAAYSLLDLKANKFIARYKQFLKQIIKIVIDEINAVNGTGYTVNDVRIHFEPETLVNETENAANRKTEAEIKQIEINIILNVFEVIGNEEALRLICEQLDIDFEELKNKLEEKQKEEGASLNDARKALDGVLTDEGGIIPPESVNGQEDGTDPTKGGVAE